MHDRHLPASMLVKDRVLRSPSPYGTGFRTPAEAERDEEPMASFARSHMVGHQSPPKRTRVQS